VTEILSALRGVTIDPNPIAVGVATFVAVISGIGLLLRQGRQNIRNDSFDKAQDKYVAALAADLQTAKDDIKAIRAELKSTAEARDTLYRLQADTSAALQTMQGKFAGLELEHANLKVEHDRIRVQYDAQSVELRTCRTESAAANRKIAALEAQVRELQAINAAHSNVARSESAAERQEHAADKQDAAADKMQSAVSRFEGKHHDHDTD
jgi:chromosome segregation ATPase